jgi:hypothetical protein
MKHLLLPVLLFASLQVFSQHDGCDKKFMPALSIAWGLNNNGLGGIQLETGIWGRDIPISGYVGLTAWTSNNDPAPVSKEQPQDPQTFCDVYIKLGVITYRGGEDARFKNEFAFTLPVKRSPEVSYAVYYVASPQVLFGIEPMYQLRTNTYGSYLRVKISL